MHVSIVVCQIASPFGWMLEMVPHTPAGLPSSPSATVDAGYTSGSSQVLTVLCVSCRLYENKGEADFVESLLQLFRSINDMMSSMSELTVRVKVGAAMLSQAQAAPSQAQRPLV